MVFSGIVEGTALVSRVTKETGLYRLEIKTDSDFSSVWNKVYINGHH